MTRQHTLKRAAFRSTVWATFGNIGQQVVGVGFFIYLAKVLSPDDFGVMAVAAAVVDMLTVVGRFGQVEALMLSPTDDHRSATSFWILVGIGLAFAALIIVLGPLLAWLYDSPELVGLMLLLSPIPLIWNLSQVQEAEIRRDFQHRVLALRNTIAAVTSGSIALGMALAGFGYWALVFQKLSYTITYTGVVLFSNRWRPRLSFDRRLAWPLLRTGFDLSVADIIHSVNLRATDIIIGYALGLAQLGQFRIAWRLFDFLFQILVWPASSIAASTFARLCGDRDAYCQALKRQLMVLTMAATPAFYGFGIVAGDVVALTIGPKWSAAAEIVCVLTWMAPTMAINSLFTPAMVNVHLSSTIRTYAFYKFVLNMLFVAAALPVGQDAVAFAFVAQAYVMLVINQRRLDAEFDLDEAFLKQLYCPTFVAGTAMAILAALVLHQLYAAAVLLRILVTATVGAGVFIAILWAGARSGLWDDVLTEMLRFWADLLHRKAGDSRSM